MNLLTTIKNIFSGTKRIASNSVVTYDKNEYVAKHAKKIEEEARLFVEKYGSDFHTFFYRLNFDRFIRSEFLPFRQANSKHNNFLRNSYWNTKHAFNFPGPFYTGESDTCGTGDVEAPKNVLYDENCMEFIFKQPQTFEEFLGVVDAAEVETLEGYSCDGNNFWSYAKCREWWQNRFDIISEMNKTETKKVNGDRVVLFESYLKSTAETDLKKYCYFLENGHYPGENIKTLPQLG